MGNGVRITAAALEKMIQHCEKEKQASGNEACGYLIGQDGLATDAKAVANAHGSPTSYQMEPIAQIALQRELRRLRLEEMAIYHSHVATEAYPSRRDIDRATAVQDFFDGYYVLVTLKDQGRPKARAFRIRDGAVQEEELREG